MYERAGCACRLCKLLQWLGLLIAEGWDSGVWSFSEGDARPNDFFRCSNRKRSQEQRVRTYASRRRDFCAHSTRSLRPTRHNLGLICRQKPLVRDSWEQMKCVTHGPESSLGKPSSHQRGLWGNLFFFSLNLSLMFSLS